MKDTVGFLLDEHVSRVLEFVLREKGYCVKQAKDIFGEGIPDEQLLQWCANNHVLLISNNVSDFERLHADIDHAGILLYSDTQLAHAEPNGVVQCIDRILRQFGRDELANSIVYLDQWYAWLEDSLD